jgi:predicted permease
MGLLVLMQLAMPPATSLSVITRHYKKEDLLISQGVFFGHIASVITIAIFLSLYFTLSVVK